MVSATLSLAQQIVDRLQTEEIILIPATLDEFWEVVEDIEDDGVLGEYDINYIDHRIRATTGMASKKHETIVANLIRVLANHFYNDADITVTGSNLLIYIAACEDITVLRGEPVFHNRPHKEPAITNPYILIEVQSDSTRKEDRGLKLRCYKQLDSVDYIIHVDQYLPYVSVFTKNGSIHHWFNDDYYSLDETVKLGDFALSMQDIYHKVSF
jgi:Uma2 family endonuclease